MIILIASISVGIAFFVAGSLPFLKINQAGVQVKTIDAIPDGISSSDQPSPSVFNSNAINPTVKTVIGKSS